jgi:shikimate 5-dehydrogenase
MRIYNDRLVATAKRFALACNCVNNIVPCTKCWKAAEADVEGYYRSIEEEEARIERKYRLYSETGKKLDS